MRSYVKKLKTVLLITLALSLVLGLAGCGKGTSSSAAAKEQQTNEQSQQTTSDEANKLSTIYTLNQIVDQKPIKIRIENVAIVKFGDATEDRKGQIALGLEIANTGDLEVNYQPEQMTVTSSTGKTLLPDLDTSEQIGGSYPVKRVMQGFMVFALGDKDPWEFSKINVKFPPVLDKNNKPIGQGITVPIDLTKLKADSQ